MNQIHIIQPAVPLYRKALFEGLKKSFYLKVRVYTASKDFLNVSSVATLDVDYYSTKYDFKTIFNGRFSLFWQSGLKLDLKKGDKLIINGNPRILSNFKQILLAKYKGVEVIWWGHGWSSTSTKFRARIRIILTHILADKVLLYTDKEVTNYIESGFKEKKVFSLNNGLDTSKINQVKLAITDDNILKFKKKHKLLGFKVAIFVGRLTEKTLAEQLIEVIPLLNKKIKIVIVGDGDKKDLLNKISHKFNVLDRVIFTGAIFEEKELARWMSAAQFFVYPGAVGLSLLHAFAYGLPAIIHNNNAKHMPEHAAFVEGVNGFLFQENDIKCLAKAINKIALKIENEKLSKNALETVKKSYNMDDMIFRFIRMLDS